MTRKGNRATFHNAIIIITLLSRPLDAMALKFIFTRSLAKDLSVMLIGSGLDCNLETEMFLTAKAVTSSDSCVRLKRCTLRKQQRLSNREECTYDCSCTGINPYEVILQVLVPRQRTLCEILLADTFIIDLP